MDAATFYFFTYLTTNGSTLVNCVSIKVQLTLTQ